VQLINKEAIVRYLMKTRNEMQADGNEYILGQKTGLATAVGIILSFHTVEERKQGHWIELEPDKYNNFIQCSECGSKFGLYSKDNYCQACGAIMEEKKGDVSND
jgi:hypothetical protein